MAGTLTYQISKLYLEDIGWGVGTTTQVRGGTTVPLTEINAANMPYDDVSSLADIYALIEAARIATEADALATNDDATQTALDVAQTQLDVAQTQLDVAQTQLDVAQTTSDATVTQLSSWESEAAKLTAISYAVEPEDVLVNLVTSDGDGTYTYTPTTDYSAFHWKQKALAIASGSIDSLSDVDTTGKVNGDALVYNSATLKWEAASISVPIPTITMASTALNEGSPTSGVVSNFNNEFKYTVTSDSGTISNYSDLDGTFTYTAYVITDGGISAPYSDTIRVNTTFGFFTSPEATETMTIVYVPIVADTAIQVVDFTNEAQINDGWSLI